ncbi:hypothetical protein [uncultured Cohaesibacter sp.]|uniref:hypothetical protein n=1 Tax=uncultured Cohaesibacter sp. TaxID=1002546 RepID=UPI00292F2EAF|nr:hypothetical protein [uncultured Cohaesibacter sp.]
MKYRPIHMCCRWKEERFDETCHSVAGFAAMAAKPREEMQELYDAVAAKNPEYVVTYALQEPGTPSLRARLGELATHKVPEVIIVSLILPMEPAFPG